MRWQNLIANNFFDMLLEKYNA